MQVLLQKIHRKSKSIKKQERLVNNNLKRKRIYLDVENFDILSVLHSATQTRKSSSGFNHFKMPVTSQSKAVKPETVMPKASSVYVDSASSFEKVVKQPSVEKPEPI